MADLQRAARTPTLRLVALAAVHGGQVLFVTPVRGNWREESGYTLVPLELPGGAAHEGEPDADG